MFYEHEKLCVSRQTNHCLLVFLHRLYFLHFLDFNSLLLHHRFSASIIFSFVGLRVDKIVKKQRESRTQTRNLLLRKSHFDKVKEKGSHTHTATRSEKQKFSTIWMGFCGRSGKTKNGWRGLVFCRRKKSEWEKMRALLEFCRVYAKAESLMQLMVKCALITSMNVVTKLFFFEPFHRMMWSKPEKHSTLSLR